MKTGFIKATVKVLWPETEENTVSFIFGVYDFEDENAMDFMARQITYAMKSIGHEFLLRNAADWLLGPDEIGSDDPIFLRPEKGRKMVNLTHRYSQKWLMNFSNNINQRQPAQQASYFRVLAVLFNS